MDINGMREKWYEGKNLLPKTLRCGSTLFPYRHQASLTDSAFHRGKDLRTSGTMTGGMHVVFQQFCPQSHPAWSWALTPVSFGFYYPWRDSQHYFLNVHRRVITSNHYRDRQVSKWLNTPMCSHQTLINPTAPSRKLFSWNMRYSWPGLTVQRSSPGVMMNCSHNLCQCWGNNRDR